MCCDIKGTFQQQSEENPRVWGEEASLFDTTADVEWFRRAAVELHCVLHVDLQGLYHALQSWWAADLWENLEQAVSAEALVR